MKKKTTAKKGPLGTPLGNPLGYFNSQKAKRSTEPKQTLRKAQYGASMPVKPEPPFGPGTDPSTGLYSSDRPVYAGPFEQRDAEDLERAFPSKGRDSLHPMNAIARANNERLTRESDFFNEGRYTEEKKGGSVKRKKK